MNSLGAIRYIILSLNICLLLLISFPIHSSALTNTITDGELLTEWPNEINISLNRNIHGHCNWTIGKTANIDGVSVSLHFPSHKEINQYNQRPLSMNKGNNKLLIILQSPNLVKWANEKGERWMIPPDHPGQDRQMCINNTRTLGLGNIVNSFYTTRYPHIERVSYLIRGRNALIYPSGAVMFSCGEYQGAEACETRWDHSLNKLRSCRDYLSKRQRNNNNNNNNPPNSKSSSSSSPSSSWSQFLQRVVDPTQKDLLEHCSINQTTAATFYKKVFVISALHDFNFHHLIADSLARLPRYLPFLHKNPYIMIHIRDWQTPYPRQDFEIIGSIKSRNMFLSLLGIDRSRVISGLIVAEKVYVPRAMSCSDALRNPAEVRLLAAALIKQAKVEVTAKTVLNEKNQQRGRKMIMKNYEVETNNIDSVSSHINNLSSNNTYDNSSASIGDRVMTSHTTTTTTSIVAHRSLATTSTSTATTKTQTLNPSLIAAASIASSSSKSTTKKKNLIILVRKNPNWGHRDWSDAEVQSLHTAFTHPLRFFHTHNIIFHSSLAITYNNFSMASEIIELTQADVLVGIHGAGLTKQMFMPTNSLVMELSGLLNDVQFPVCGYYGNMAYMFGHHHYLYAYDRDNGNNHYDIPISDSSKTKSSDNNSDSKNSNIDNKRSTIKGGELMDPEDVAEEAWKYYQYIHSQKSSK